TVACLWARRLVILDLTERKEASPVVLDLPFASRRQLLLPGTSRLLVADSFGGRLAVVDLRRKAIESVRSLPIHRLRGMRLDRRGKGLWLTHQTLHARGRPNPTDIRSANLLTNTLHWVALATLLDPLADLRRDDQHYRLGDVERGAGDPADVIETDDGQILIALAGLDELAIGRPAEVLWNRIAVGHRPTAFAVDSKRRRAYVASTFSD